MDTFTTLTGAFTMFFIYMGERFQVGVYLWLAALFSIIFALRMGEEMFYMGTAGILAVMIWRTWLAHEDVRDDSEIGDA